MKTILLMVLLASSYKVYTNEGVIQDIRELENKLELPTGSFEALIKVESRFNRKAINRKAPVHSYGIGQLTLATAKFCGLTRKTILDYKKNLECSANLFKAKLDKYKQDLDKAVVAYNDGTPCICDRKIYRRNLGVTKLICFKKLINSGKVILKPMKCAVEGKLLETNYLQTFKQAYNSL